MGAARETALASSTYSPFTWRLLTFTGWNWKCYVIIVIKTDLSGFVVPMPSGLCEQYVKSLGLRPRDLTSCFARALVHWDNKPLQNRSYSLNYTTIVNDNLSIDDTCKIVIKWKAPVKGPHSPKKSTWWWTDKSWTETLFWETLSTSVKKT